MPQEHLTRRFPVKLPGTIWGIVAYFNPAHYASKPSNFRQFRESLRSQGLPLAAVELVHDKAPPELYQGDAEILVHRRGGAVLWQKERLLNIALEHLPADCDKVVWLDADVLFESRNWVADTAARLEQYAFVQPFSSIYRLPPQCTSRADCGKSPIASSPGAASLWSRRPGRPAGEPGFAMAARRSVLAQHGLYDRMILGGGDRVILSAAMGIDPALSPYVSDHPEGLVNDARQWCQRIAAQTNGSLSFVEGNLLHLWHGTPANRRYAKRARLLEGFDVHEDLRLDGQGVWSWSSDKPRLQQELRRYFLLRREDDQPQSAWQKPWSLAVARLLDWLRAAPWAGRSSRWPQRTHQGAVKERPEDRQASSP